MSHHSNCQIVALSLSVLLFLSLAPGLTGQQLNCTNAMLEGWYGAGGEGSALDFPEPGMTSRFAFTGNMRFDGQGNVTEFKDTINLNGQQILQRDVVAMTGGASGEYSVESDCQFDLVDPSGQSTFRGVILNGGREGWLLQTGGPLPNVLGFFSFKKITPIDQELIRTLDSIRLRLGIPPGN